MRKNINFVIIGDLFGFPEGYAATKYIRLLGKGLHHTGSRVRVIIPVYTESPESAINKSPRGVVDGVTYEYTTGSPVWPDTRWECRLGKLRGRLAAWLRIVLMAAGNRLDAVILYSRSPDLLESTGRLCRLLRIPLIVYMVEWRMDGSNQSEAANRRPEQFYNNIPAYSNAVVAISHFIKEQVDRLASEVGCRLPCLITSILCNPEEWKSVAGIRNQRPYLLYCADLEGYSKDTAYVLSAFSTSRLTEHDLVLIGPATPEFTAGLKDKAADMGIGNRVRIISDHLSNSDLRSFIKGADALLAPLNDDVRSKARFPSKIGDYFMSGNAVVTCNVGEVAHYLHDGINAFVAEPGSAEAFAEKISEAVNSPKRAQVAKNGYDLAVREFNCNSRAAALLNFLRSHHLIRNNYSDQ